MKEIGGYIELERYNGKIRYGNAKKINLARNALVYIIRAKGIKKIHIPLFLCNSVRNVCISEGIKVCEYKIDENFFPKDVEFAKGDWIYLVNYYGQYSVDVVEEMKKKYCNIILDNTQAYYAEPIEGIDTIYSCRKYFGVPDGAILFTDVELTYELDMDFSFERMTHIIGRFEKSSEFFYEIYVKNEHQYDELPLKRMSKLTENILKSIDYDYVMNKRNSNYTILSKQLDKYNYLKIKKNEGPFCYPLMIKNGDELRKKLINNKVFIPLLWPEVLEKTKSSDLEFCLSKNILPIPCDQRYNDEDMFDVCSIIKDYII